METKKIIRRNLPINDIYILVDSYYTGSLVDGFGTICQNCNKLITNVAVIENKEKQKFNVGLDCAETLKSLDYFDLNSAKADFNEAKAIRAKVNKALKEGKQVDFLINYFGKLNIFCLGKFSEIKDMYFVKKFLPDYIKKVSNSEKIGFNYDSFNLDLSKLKDRKNEFGLSNESFDIVINSNKYTLNVRITEKKFFSQKENKENTLYKNEYDLTLNNELKETKEAFLKSDLEYKFNLFISKNEFILFNTLETN